MNNAVNADMSEFWNGDGGERWVNFHQLTHEFLQPFGREAMEAAAIAQGERVLDIGCGCGDTSFDMARSVGPAGHVHGLDISKPIIAEARSRKAQLELKNVTFGCADAQVHQLEPELFDVAYSRFGIMFFDDPAAALSNIGGSLGTGGRLAFACWQPVADNKWVSLSLETVGRHVPLPEPPGSEEPGPFSFGDPQRIIRILSEADFSGIEIAPKNETVSFGRSIEQATSFLMQLGPAGSAITQAEPDAETISEIAQDMGKALAPHHSGQGVNLGAAAWVVTARKSD